MNRNELEQLSIAKLYGEIEERDLERLDAWLDAHPEDLAEFAELQKTFQFLNRLEDAPASQQPIRLPMPVEESPARPVSSPFSWWKVAAAAVLVFFVAGFWRGVEMQVGSVRLAIGPTQTASKASLQEMAQTVLDVHTVNETLLLRQQEMGDQIEQLATDTTLLKTVQVAGQLMTDQKLKVFSEELVRQINNKMGAYQPYTQNAMYNEASFQNRGDREGDMSPLEQLRSDHE
jgi:hypothetical protein